MCVVEQRKFLSREEASFLGRPRLWAWAGYIQGIIAADEAAEFRCEIAPYLAYLDEEGPRGEA